MDDSLQKGGILKVWGILEITILIAALGGCIDQQNPMNLNTSENNSAPGGNSNQTLEGSNMGNDSAQNQISLIADSKDFNTTGKLRLTLMIQNPIANETVLTVFSPEFMPIWYNQTTITKIKNDSWLRNYSIKPGANTTYIKMFVQVSENNSVIKKASWNITVRAPAGGQG